MSTLKPARERALSLSPSAVRRAIVIDFEGEGGRPGKPAPPPAMLGILTGERHRAILLDPRLHIFDKARRGMTGVAAKGDWNATFASLADEAESEDRVLLYFSQHEHAVLSSSELIDRATWSRLAPRLADAKALLKKACLRKLGKDLPSGERTLEGYAGLWCPKRVAGQDDVAVGETLRAIVRSCDGVHRLGCVPARTWTLLDNLLRYNLDDLRITRKACVSAANLLASR